MSRFKYFQQETISQMSENSTGDNRRATLPEVRYTVDVRGQECSKPVVTVKTKLGAVSSGQTIEVLATDTAYEDIVRIFRTIQGHEVLEVDEGEFFRLFITKK